MRRASKAKVVVAATLTTPQPSSSSSSGQASGSKSAHSSLVFSSSNSSDSVAFGFPKGSLQQATEDLFARAGFSVKFSSSRSYFPSIDDDMLKLVLFRSQEISRYVEDGILDAGICGHDWIIENGSDIVEVCELKYSKATSNPASWVIAVPEESDVKTLQDLDGKIVASELVETTKKYFEQHGVNVKVEFSWGATEVKAKLPGIAAIVDITETGSSLRANKLRILDTILSSTTRLIANKTAMQDPVKAAKIEDLALLLQGAIAGRQSVGLKLNCLLMDLESVVAVLPSQLSPTVSPLKNGVGVAVEVVLDEAQARDVVAAAKRVGATDIVTYPLGMSVQ